MLCPNKQCSISVISVSSGGTGGTITHCPSCKTELVNITPKAGTTPSTEQEHLLMPGEGTQTACTCGKSFGATNLASQHQQWHLQTQALLAQERNKAYDEGRQSLLDKITNAYFDSPEFYKNLKSQLKKESTQ